MESPGEHGPGHASLGPSQRVLGQVPALVFIGLALPHLGGAPPETVLIRVFNTSDLSAESVAEASAVASQIFREAGVGTFFVECSSSSPRPLPCVEPGPLIEVTLAIVREGGPAGSGQMGKAVTSAAGGPGGIAWVRAGEVSAVARSWSLPVGLLLGHVEAHEIGHLLLGQGSHSPTGIMRAHWTWDDVALVVAGKLLFNRDQCRLLHAQVSPPAGSLSATGR